jgi:glycosyltransferase involved in cell wall biosynthesis
MSKKFTIIITTKNRLIELKFTLKKIASLLASEEFACIICDDGSSDDTAAFLQAEYPDIKCIQNKKSRGLIYSRNRLMHLVTTEFAISLDDDAHFITEPPQGSIAKHFDQNPVCGLIALRVFWGQEIPNEIISNEKISRVKGFVGCAHVWRMKAWYSIPQYPSWFVFYGEEDFAAYQLFKKGWEIHYLPEVLVNHRVNIKERKKGKDYYVRIRRSLRSGWYLMLLFYPKKVIPKMFLYTLWVQIKNKPFKGDILSLFYIFRALLDVLININKIIRDKNRLSMKEYLEFKKLNDTNIYWKPKN